MTGASTGKMSSSKIVMNEAAAKAAWLAKLDSPVFGKDRASPLSEPTYDAPAASMAASTSETAAKAAWLAKLDAPAWGHKAAPTNEAAAKAAWLAKLDAPVWGQGRVVPTSADGQVPDLVAESAPAAYNDAAAAKAAWLAKLDTPVWGRAAALPNEAAAKAAWLAKLDAPAWGKGAAAQDAAQEVVQEATPVFAPLDAIGKVVPNVPVIAWWMRSDTREVQFGRM